MINLNKLGAPTKQAINYLDDNYNSITWDIIKKIAIKKTASGRACTDLLTSDRDHALCASYLTANISAGVYSCNLIIALAGEIYQVLHS